MFFTKTGKSFNYFFKNLRILNKDQRFSSRGMTKPARGEEKSRRMENSREMKIPVNGKFPVNEKIPRDEKLRGFLVMEERNCLTLKNPCFIKECNIIR